MDVLRTWNVTYLKKMIMIRHYILQTHMLVMLSYKLLAKG